MPFLLYYSLTQILIGYLFLKCKFCSNCRLTPSGTPETPSTSRMVASKISVLLLAIPKGPRFELVCLIPTTQRH